MSKVRSTLQKTFGTHHQHAPKQGDGVVVPSSDELKAAVAKVLETYHSPGSEETGTRNGAALLPSIKTVCKLIEADHPNWKVPERRVKKFVNRVVKKSLNADDDFSHIATDDTVTDDPRHMDDHDDDRTTASIMSRMPSARGLFKRVFRGKKTNDGDRPPVGEIYGPVDAPLGDGNNESKDHADPVEVTDDRDSKLVERTTEAPTMEQPVVETALTPAIDEHCVENSGNAKTDRSVSAYKDDNEATKRNDCCSQPCVIM